MSNTEKEFMDWLMIELCAIPGVRVWRQNSGKIVFRDGARGIRTFQSGVPKGAGDLSGIYEKDGRRIEVETKAPGGRLSNEQRHWGEFIRQYNGLYMLASQRPLTEPRDDAVRCALEFRSLLQGK